MSTVKIATGSPVYWAPVGTPLDDRDAWTLIGRIAAEPLHRLGRSHLHAVYHRRQKRRKRS
jgi:hypothetical protein